LRITGVDLDQEAQALLAEDGKQTIRLIGGTLIHSPKDREQAETDLRELHGLSADEIYLLFRGGTGKHFRFTERLCIQGFHEGGVRVFRAGARRLPIR